jgi:hypothetical protein
MNQKVFKFSIICPQIFHPQLLVSIKPYAQEIISQTCRMMTFVREGSKKLNRCSLVLGGYITPFFGFWSIPWSNYQPKNWWISI